MTKKIHEHIRADGQRRNSSDDSAAPAKATPATSQLCAAAARASASAASSASVITSRLPSRSSLPPDNTRNWNSATKSAWAWRGRSSAAWATTGKQCVKSNASQHNTTAGHSGFGSFRGLPAPEPALEAACPALRRCLVHAFECLRLHGTSLPSAPRQQWRTTPMPEPANNSRETAHHNHNHHHKSQGDTPARQLPPSQR